MKKVEPILHLLRVHAGWLLVVWSLILLLVGLWFVQDESMQERVTIRREAEAISRHDLLYRNWVSQHGGVYVPVSAELQPNPYLAHHPERDLTTPSGRQLTLVNPDYLTRLISATKDDSFPHGHVVSLDPIRPEDAPDPWEREALLAMQGSGAAQSAFVEEDGQQFYRFMQPLRVESSCLPCHQVHGYQVGEVHGALSFTIAADRLPSTRGVHVSGGLLVLLVVWLLGIAGIFFSAMRLRTQMQHAQQQTLQLSQAQQNVEYLTYFDPLTALPNRLRFSALMQQHLTAAAATGAELAIGVIGVDHFKKLKNTFGPQVGEEMLRAVVQRLEQIRQPDDVLACLSEGRFLVLLPVSGESERITPFVQQLQASLTVPILIEGQEFFVTTSCGFARYPRDGEDEKILISAADAAYSRAKAMGRNSYLSYSPQFKSRALEQITLENTLRRAQERNELEVFYQPQVDARSGRIVGAEALLRWRNPEVGMISPLEFIPLAEESGMIFTIGQWVLENACRAAHRWNRELGQSVAISVNVSPRQFQQTDLVAAVDQALTVSGLNPLLLVLEITEGSIVEDVDRAVVVLNELKGRGIRIAIDDFGIGYSSLSYLRHFPIDMVKIDKSFVLDIHQKDNSNVIISSIITMARRMELELVAEGVETEGQRDYLLALGCGTMQGFYYSRPLDGTRFSELLAALQISSSDYSLWWQSPAEADPA